MSPRFTSPCIERRSGDRREDSKGSRLLLRVLSIQRVFGATTASQLLRRAGMDEEPLHALMAVGKDRRRVRRRCRAPTENDA